MKRQQAPAAPPAKPAEWETERKPLTIGDAAEMVEKFRDWLRQMREYAARLPQDNPEDTSQVFRITADLESARVKLLLYRDMLARRSE